MPYLSAGRPGIRIGDADLLGEHSKGGREGQVAKLSTALFSHLLAPDSTSLTDERVLILAPRQIDR